MKILHLVSQDNGGAGRATIRLHQALLDQGIDSQMVVQTKTSDLPTIHTLAQSKFQKLITPFRQAFDQLPTLFYKNRLKDTFSSTFLPKNKNLLKKIREINPDIIHLHWIGSGFINIFDLEQINRPILWSLHDANPFTGGCHVAYHGCDKYKTSCNTCPFLGSNFKYDLSYCNFKRKQKAYKKLNLTINGLSRWIANEAKSSALFKNKDVVNLPNPIDTKIFRPIDKNTARNMLDLTTNKILLGFGAVSATQIPRKGYSQLIEALEILPDKHQYKLVVFGSSHGKEVAGIETIFLGHLYDDVTLALFYNSLDLFITPSLAENLSNTIMESLACGTPVIAFDIGGNSDMIHHQQNGFLAKGTQELANGVLWCLNNPAQLSLNARSTILTKFDYNIVVQRYIDTYIKLHSLQREHNDKTNT